MSSKKEVIIYGLGNDYEDFKGIIEENYKVLGYSDSDSKKAELYTPFVTIEEIREKQSNVLIASTKFLDEIKVLLISKGIDENRIEDGGLKRLISTPVIVVTMQGGTGNVMFCYAFGMMLQKIHPDIPVYFDMSWFDRDGNTSFGKPNVIFENLFKLSFPSANAETMKLAKRQGQIKQRESLLYEEEYFEIEQGFFSGYWQSGKYFYKVKDEIRKKFTFNEGFMSPRQRKLLEKIRKTESVAVWLRRGDYLTVAVNDFGGLCTQEYYDRAMEYIRLRCENAEFFIFSNDSEYISEKYKEYNLMVYEDNTSDIKDYDMYLMSACKHLIIANSTFAWWAAWLHGDNGMIISPKKWLNNREDKDIWEEHWIKM